MDHHPDFSICEQMLTCRHLLPILTFTTSTRRFGEIQEALPGISRGVLSEQLTKLLSFGLISQTRHTCFPPRVEYTATEKGRALLDILSALP